MRVVLSRFPMEIYRGVAGIIGRRLRSFILAAEALETRPGFEQRAIDGEMFVREQTGRACLCEDRVEERTGNVALEQAVPIFAERRRRPDRVVHPQPDKPSKQHAVVDLFHQQALAPYGVERLQHQRAQQLLGGNRRPTNIRIHLRKARRQVGEHAVRHHANRAQRMIGAHALLGRQVTEHVAGLLVGSTHVVAPFRNVGSIVVRRDHDVDPS